MATKSHAYVKRIIISALLVALGVVFSRLLSVPITSFSGTYSLNIGFGLLPILLLSILYGPIWGMIGAMAWDMTGALLFPQGAFNVLFTLSAASVGLVSGLFFAKNRAVTIERILLSCFCGQFVYSVILNTLLLYFLYRVPMLVTLVPRAIENVIMFVINTLLLTIIIDIIRNHKLLPERFPDSGTSMSGQLNSTSKS